MSTKYKNILLLVANIREYFQILTGFFNPIIRLLNSKDASFISSEGKSVLGDEAKMKKVNEAVTEDRDSKYIIVDFS